MKTKHIQKVAELKCTNLVINNLLDFEEKKSAIANHKLNSTQINTFQTNKNFRN